MTRSISYDQGYDPPAPVVRLVISGSRGRNSAIVHALLDTGADATVVPEDVVETLGLPLVRYAEVEGVAGEVESVGIHSAVVTVAGATMSLEVVALGDERIAGRDLLSLFVTRLDGPRQQLSLEVPPAPRRSRPRR